MRPLSIVASMLLAACGALPPPALPPQEREAVPRPIGRPQVRPTTVELADVPPLGEDDVKNAFSFGLGAYYWNDLGSLSTAGTGWSPDQFGEFDRWGFAVDLAYDRVVGRIGGAPWSLGLQFGVGTFQNDGRGVDPFSDRLDATLVHIVPTARVRVPLSQHVALVPGAGVGAYWLSVDEYDRSSWGYAYHSRRLYDEWALGGFGSVGLEIDVDASGGALWIDNEFHWVAFDGIGRLLPAEDSVGGLVYALQIGYAMRF